MERIDETKPVQDYWKFTRELRSQLNAIKSLERMFFELDNICEWSVKNQVTLLNDDGERVSVIDDCLGDQQCQVYMKLKKAVGDLDKMLVFGESCFINQKEKSNGKS